MARQGGRRRYDRYPRTSVTDARVCTVMIVSDRACFLPYDTYKSEETLPRRGNVVELAVRPAVKETRRCAARLLFPTARKKRPVLLHFSRPSDGGYPISHTLDPGRNRHGLPAEAHANSSQRFSFDIGMNGATRITSVTRNYAPESLFHMHTLYVHLYQFADVPETRLPRRVAPRRRTVVEFSLKLAKKPAYNLQCKDIVLYIL